MEKIIWIKTYINLWRTLIVYIFLSNCKFKNKFKKDLKVWKSKKEILKNKSDFISFSFLCFDTIEFRNVFLNRLHRNIFMYIISRFLFKPLDSLYINMPPEKIGGGLYFQHGFSTIIAAKEIGENCSINQQVTIGYKEEEAPILCDNIIVCAGAIIIGNVKIFNGAKIGAGAVVTHDVAENKIVAGVPAKIINKKD